jgi:hypothetical protein
VAVIPGLPSEFFDCRRSLGRAHHYYRVLGTRHSGSHPPQSPAAHGGFLSAIPTKLLAEYVGEDRPERIAATIYGLNLLLTAVLVSAVWRYAVREGLIRPDIADEYVKLITRRLTPGLVGYAVMIMLGLFLPLAAVLGYLIIAVYNLIPFRGVRRRGRRPTRAATETPLLSVALPDTGSPSGVTLIQPPNATLQLTDRQGGLTYFRSSLVPWTGAISGFTPDG